MMQVAGGQGTIAFELLADLRHLDAVFVPVGGGGMISGIAGQTLLMKLREPHANGHLMLHCLGVFTLMQLCLPEPAHDCKHTGSRSCSTIVQM